MATEQTIHQYNGLLLLTSYLHRMYIAEQLKASFAHTSLASAAELRSLLDDVHMLRARFEQSQQLHPTEQQQLLHISADTKRLIEHYMPSEQATFLEKVAIVTATMFGEKEMNDGVLRLQQLFQLKISDDFYARIPFYRERTQAMDRVVQHLECNEPIPKSIKQLVHSWYENIYNQSNLVSVDLARIDELVLS